MDEDSPKPASPFERPMGVFESLGAALRVYGSNANTLLMIVAIVVIPVTILTVLLVRFSFGDLATLSPADQQNPFAGLSRSEITKIVSAFLVGTILNLVISMIAIGLSYRAIRDALSGIKPDWRTSIRAALGKVRALVWLPVLIGLLFLGGLAVGIVAVGLLDGFSEQLGALASLALICAAIYAFVVWSVAIPVLMSEDRRGLSALSRSQELVAGEWWPTFGVFALGFVLVVIVSTMLSAIFDVGGRTGNEGLVLATIYAVITNLLFTPFQAALGAVVYLNLALKKSGAGAAPRMPLL
ncbi:MAG: hypothetical protein QOG04_867 [Actinomycetota bacterium]|jgi:hypothetical protein|nr:hypothetical protein [Actinomycetota bacterium]